MPNLVSEVRFALWWAVASQVLKDEVERTVTEAHSALSAAEKTVAVDKGLIRTSIG